MAGPNFMDLPKPTEEVANPFGRVAKLFEGLVRDLINQKGSGASKLSRLLLTLESHSNSILSDPSLRGNVADLKKALALMSFAAMDVRETLENNTTADDLKPTSAAYLLTHYAKYVRKLEAAETTTITPTTGTAEQQFESTILQIYSKLQCEENGMSMDCFRNGVTAYINAAAKKEIEQGKFAIFDLDKPSGNKFWLIDFQAGTMESYAAFHGDQGNASWFDGSQASYPGYADKSVISGSNLTSPGLYKFGGQHSGKSVKDGVILIPLDVGNSTADDYGKVFHAKGKGTHGCLAVPHSDFQHVKSEVMNTGYGLFINFTKDPEYKSGFLEDKPYQNSSWRDYL